MYNKNITSVSILFNQRKSITLYSLFLVSPEMRIHMSEASSKALHRLGGYNTTFRGEIDVKVGMLLYGYKNDRKLHYKELICRPNDLSNFITFQ